MHRPKPIGIQEKQKLHVSDLLAKFQIASGGEFANDRMILSN